MLFNSYEFIYLLLPVTVIIYFLLNKKRLVLASTAWLVFASLFFYSWWNIKYLPLLSGSIIFNFAIGTVFGKTDKGLGKYNGQVNGKLILIFGVAANLALLGYFKYTNFFISSINHLTGTQFHLLHIILPLSISFFTFTQIAYLVDAYKGKAKEYDFLNYSLFVTFFPHLIAGPIIHHKEMMPQFYMIRNKVLSYKNLSVGLFLFFIGFVKKVVIADTCAIWANSGFDTEKILTLAEAWITSLSYTFQIYFDFSGYTDMALGAALMFNIKLPINFNSPYIATDVRDFWRRWHVTLTRFLRDYVYIPLGGNRINNFRTLQNIIITFLLGGLWHGAAWTFVFWGGLHGTAMIVHRLWEKLNIIKLPKYLAWFITFNFVNITWIFFRAKNWPAAVRVLKGMMGMSRAGSDTRLEDTLPLLNQFIINFESLDFISGNMSKLYLFIALFSIVMLCINSNQMVDSIYLSKEFWGHLKNWREFWIFAVILMLILMGVLLFLARSSVATPFIYTLF